METQKPNQVVKMIKKPLWSELLKPVNSIREETAESSPQYKHCHLTFLCNIQKMEAQELRVDFV